MGRLLIRGVGAALFLDNLLSAHVGKLKINHSSYALMCRDDGGVIDDVFLYHIPDGIVFGAEAWLVVVNASNLTKDKIWLSSHAGQDVTVEDISDRFSMIAVQGPRAVDLVDAFCSGKVESIPRFGARECQFDGAPVFLGRTGYTGEDGVEIYVDAERTVRIWERLLDTAEARGIEVGPIGLAARDSLRFESGFALYGHELTEETTPIEAGLKWACDFSRPFVGREAILEHENQTESKRLVTLKMVEKGVPREGCPVFLGDSRGSELVGTVVSGLYAPTADGYYANGYVPARYATKDTLFSVEIRGRRKSAIVVRRPIYRPVYRTA